MPRRLQVLLAFAALCLACGSARDRAGAADSGEAAPAAGGAGAAVSGASTATTSSAARAFGAVAGALTATTSSAARSVEGAASAARSVEGAASAAMTATTSSVARGRSAADADHADVAARNPDVADAAVPVPDAPDSAVLAREAPDAAVLAPDAPDATVPDVVSADIADAAVDAAPASADSGGLDEGYAGPYVMVQGETAFDAPPSPNEGGLGFFGQADASAAVALPFAFAYFGKIHPPGTRLFVTSHGTVFIGNGVVEQKNVALPRGDAPYGVIAPFWDSLRFGFDAYATATAHAVDVIWYLAAHADGDAEAVTFKLTLTPSGLVRFTYYYGTSGYSATVGLSDPTGQLVYQLPCSPHCDPTLDVPPGTVISFVPSDATVARRDLAAVGFAPQLPQFVYLGEHLTSGSPVIKNVGGQTWTDGFVYRILASSTDGPFSIGGPTEQLFAELHSGALAPGQEVRLVNEARGPMMPPSRVGTHTIALAIDASEDDNPANDLLRLGQVEVRDYLGVCLISTTRLPTGTVGTPYNARIALSGCPNAQWRVTPPLPPGLTLGADGRITGTPTRSSTLGHEFRVTPPRGYKGASVSLSLIIGG